VRLLPLERPPQRNSHREPSEPGSRHARDHPANFDELTATEPGHRARFLLAFF